MFFMALCTSSLDAETPRSAYLFEVSELILLLCRFVACPPKEDGANINIFLVFAYSVFGSVLKSYHKKKPIQNRTGISIKIGSCSYLVSNNSLYFVNVQIWSSTSNSSLSQWFLISSKYGFTLLQYASAIA